MAEIKFINQAGFTHFVEQLYANGIKDKALVAKTLIAKLEAMKSAAENEEELAGMKQNIQALQDLIQADSDGAINKFNEIVTFLDGIKNGEGSKDLEALLADIATQIADAKKAGTDADAALKAYKTTNDAAVADAKKAGTDATAALNAYKTSNDAALAEDKQALADYKTANDAALAADQKALADYKSSNDAAVALKANAADFVPMTDAEINSLIEEAK